MASYNKGRISSANDAELNENPIFPAKFSCDKRLQGLTPIDLRNKRPRILLLK